MEYRELIYELKDEIATITFNRKEKRNSFTPRLGIELADSLIEADKDDNVRVVIITGAGNDFCVGADLSSGSKIFADFADAKKDEEVVREKAFEQGLLRETKEGRAGEWGGAIVQVLLNLKKPVISAINGACVGVGAALVLAMDFRIAEETTRLGYVFVRRGVVPESLSPWLLPKIIGFTKAMELVLTGKIINAKEAKEIGLVNEVVPKEKLMDYAKALARELVEKTAPVSIALTRRMMYQFLSETDPVKVERINHSYFFWASASADCVEGIKAFLEKRNPNWKLKPGKDLPPFYPLG